MEYNFKVGDKVKMTMESHTRGMNRRIGLDDYMLVSSLTSWDGPAYYLVDYDGGSAGIWKENEFEPFEKERVVVKVSTNQTHTKTMWALVLKSAPNALLSSGDLFTTRADARKEKSKNDLSAFKVVKVNLNWEG